MACRLCEQGVPREKHPENGLIHATPKVVECNTPSRKPGQSVSVVLVGWEWFPFDYCEENPDSQTNWGASGEAGEAD